MLLGAYSYGLPMRKWPVASWALNGPPEVQAPRVTDQSPVARSGSMNRPLSENVPFLSASGTSTRLNVPSLRSLAPWVKPVSLHSCE